MVDDIWGVGFKTADQIAQSVGIQFDSQQRVRAGIIHAIATAVQSGSLYVELDGLYSGVIALLGLDESEHEHLVKNSLKIYMTAKSSNQ